MASWHPILESVEPVPAVWVLIDQYEREYGRVTFVRRGSELGYRAEARGVLVGYFTRLLPAVMAAHLAYVNSMGRTLPPNGFTGSWG